MTEKRPRISFIRADNFAGAYYRIFLPCLALSEKGYTVRLDTPPAELPGADIIVFQRDYHGLGADEIFWLKNKGIKIVLDFDDNYFAIDLHNPVKFQYGDDTLRDMSAMLSAADLVTTTVQPLADSYSRFSKNIAVLPNYINESALNFPRNKPAKLTVGWQGSQSHHEDLRKIKSLINNLQKKYNFEFILAGYGPRGFFRNFILREHEQFSPELAHQRLFNDFDIGICPLEDTLFNRCKSDLKFLEYSSLGIPTVASKMVPYESIKHGETGYLARNLGEWERYLTELIEDEDKRLAIGQAAKEYVAAERTIQKNIWRWEEVYNNL